MVRAVRVLDVPDEVPVREADVKELFAPARAEPAEESLEGPPSYPLERKALLEPLYAGFCGPKVLLDH